MVDAMDACRSARSPAFDSCAGRLAGSLSGFNRLEERERSSVWVTDYTESASCLPDVDRQGEWEASCSESPLLRNEANSAVRTSMVEGWRRASFGADAVESKFRLCDDVNVVAPGPSAKFSWARDSGTEHGGPTGAVSCCAASRCSEDCDFMGCSLFGDGSSVSSQFRYGQTPSRASCQAQSDFISRNRRRFLWMSRLSAVS